MLFKPCQAARPESIGSTYCGTRWYRAPEIHS